MKPLRWHELIPLNIHWFGLNIATGSITPVLLPYLVALYVPPDQKNTDLATIRVASLAMAMLAQPLAGLISDRNTLRWGRRRPVILAGTLLSLVFLFVVGASTWVTGATLQSAGSRSAFAVLLAGIVLWQMSSNSSQGALQGLIPDVVPKDQRGRASGVKAVMELSPILLIIFISPLVDAGRVWLTLGLIMAVLLITTAVTLRWVRETPLEVKPEGRIRGQVARLASLTAIFVATTQIAVWLVSRWGVVLEGYELNLGQQITLLGLGGLAGMLAAIFIGVYLGARVGIGASAHRQRSFIWWVINRLMFLAAVGSIQGFAQFYLSDVLQVARPVTETARLMVIVAAFLIPAALGGGYMADRMGLKRLVGLSGFIAGCGSLLLLVPDLRLVMAAAGIIGLGAGMFMSSSWALGTRLAPSREAGRYLGVSNLAGAGAGIVGAGIGGPLADAFNRLQPGLGYLVIFALYGSLFLLSILALTQVESPE